MDSSNFECLEAMDIELFNQQMSALLRGRRSVGADL